ncbi:hypothetical protein D3C72_2081690 [compost metagenome]
MVTLVTVAAIPPIVTADVVSRLEPFIETDVPEPPDEGVNEYITGGGKNVKPAIFAVPLGPEIFTLPLLPVPTVAVIIVGETTEKDVALTPPKFTDCMPVKLLPVMVTVCPAAATTGLMLWITGEE